MHPPIAITAASLLTPLDTPASTTWDALRADRRVTTHPAIPDTLLPNTPPDLDRSIRLALAAIQRLPSPLDLSSTHLFCATSKGPATTVLTALDQLRVGQPLTPLQARQITLGPAAMATLLPQFLPPAQPPFNPRHTSIAACASGLHALHRALRALQHHECPRALVVAADASLHPLFESSFQRLGVLAPLEPDNSRRCTPFGPDGQGFFLIEAAAAFLLQRADTLPSNTQSLALIDHTAIAADSTALIAIDEHTQTLRTLLHHAIDQREPIGFIHAHATGTAHDQYELAALQSVAPATTPIFSHKRWLGHSLGAAGLVSLALSLLVHQYAITPSGIPINPRLPSLTLAQGFGGHIALLRVRTMPQ